MHSRRTSSGWSVLSSASCLRARALGIGDAAAAASAAQSTIASVRASTIVRDRTLLTNSCQMQRVHGGGVLHKLLCARAVRSAFLTWWNYCLHANIPSSVSPNSELLVEMDIFAIFKFRYLHNMQNSFLNGKVLFISGCQGLICYRAMTSNT